MNVSVHGFSFRHLHARANLLIPLSYHSSLSDCLFFLVLFSLFARYHPLKI